MFNRLLFLSPALTAIYLLFLALALPVRAAFPSPPFFSSIPYPWQTDGNGSFSYRRGVFSIEAGPLILARIYQVTSGDVLIRAKVSAAQSNSPTDFEEAGLNLAGRGGVVHFRTWADYDGNLVRIGLWQRDSSANSTEVRNLPLSQKPKQLWLKLKRSGSLIVAYYSVDRIDWEKIETSFDLTATPEEAFTTGMYIYGSSGGKSSFTRVLLLPI